MQFLGVKETARIEVRAIDDVEIGDIDVRLGLLSLRSCGDVFNIRCLLLDLRRFFRCSVVLILTIIGEDETAIEIEKIGITSRRNGDQFSGIDLNLQTTETDIRPALFCCTGIDDINITPGDSGCAQIKHITARLELRCNNGRPFVTCENDTITAAAIGEKHVIIISAVKIIGTCSNYNCSHFLSNKTRSYDKSGRVLNISV